MLKLYHRRVELYLNELVIVQSLPANERQTGTELQRHLHHDPAFPVPVRLEPAFSAAELMVVLEQLAIQAERTAWRPMVHIEVHGNNEGCGTASGEFLYWDQVAAPLRRLNVATRNSLVVAASACMGAYLATAAARHPAERAPFCGVVGPDAEVYDENLLNGFREYYAELASTREFQLALHKIQAKWLPECRAFDTGDIFRKGIAHYSQRWLSGPLLHERLTGIIRQHRRAGTAQRRGRKVSRREIARNLRNDTERIDRYWRRFIMADLFSENDARFKPLRTGA
jgi:hypothetical protein